MVYRYPGDLHLNSTVGAVPASNVVESVEISMSLPTRGLRLPMTLERVTVHSARVANEELVYSVRFVARCGSISCRSRTLRYLREEEERARDAVRARVRRPSERRVARALSRVHAPLDCVRHRLALLEGRVLVPRDELRGGRGRARAREGVSRSDLAQSRGRARGRRREREGRGDHEQDAARENVPVRCIGRVFGEAVRRQEAGPLHAGRIE